MNANAPVTLDTLLVGFRSEALNAIHHHAAIAEAVAVIENSPIARTVLSSVMQYAPFPVVTADGQKGFGFTDPDLGIVKMSVANLDFVAESIDRDSDRKLLAQPGVLPTILAILANAQDSVITLRATGKTTGVIVEIHANINSHSCVFDIARTQESGGYTEIYMDVNTHPRHAQPYGKEITTFNFSAPLRSDDESVKIHTNKLYADLYTLMQRIAKCGPAVKRDDAPSFGRLDI